MNNSVFGGKTIENVRNRVDIELVNNESRALKIKDIKRWTIFDDNLVAVHKQRMNIKLCKPIYLGQTILDQSKHLMYDFHYNFILKKIDRENVDLLFTDTDSLYYNIRKQDIFKIIKENEDLFDLSNYPKDSEMYNGKNNKVIGKFKNESIKQITEFVGLRSKLYIYTVEEDEDRHNRCKGIKKSVAETINISEYKNTLDTRKSVEVTKNSFRTHEHQIYTESVCKTALSARDDKVFICEDNINTYNFKHWRIRDMTLLNSILKYI